MKLIVTLSLIFLSLNVHASQKVVLISGGTGGIGMAAVKNFEDKGWKVWAGRRQNIPEEIIGHPHVSIVPLDVTDEQSIRAAIKHIMLTDGRIDALVNNAGYGIIGSEENVSLDEAQKLFDVNFFGALRLTQAVIPFMREQGYGHIINISSTSGVRAVPGLGLYAASKFALEGLSESLAVTLSPWNIKVSIVEPGSVKNDWVNHCVIQEKDHDDPIYFNLTTRLFEKLTLFAATAQECNEIGALILQIAETDEPDMRYQTSEKVKTVVGKKLVDPSGNQMRSDQLLFLKALIE